jgi:5-methylcytosine-specific restriction endonuclease McrA
MLEGVRLTRNGNFGKGDTIYIYKESCAKCGKPYLTQKSRQSKFCSQSCAVSGENNPFFGETHTSKIRKKMSKNRPSYKGSLNPAYKGGVVKTGLTTYDTHKNTLDLYEDIRKQKGTEILEVKCVYCGRWYAPKQVQVSNRLASINNLNNGENRFYCSENCKLACSTYNQKMYPRGFKHTTSREVSTYLRQIVLKRDNWTCQICGKTVNEAQLHVHHMDPVAQNPMFQNDIDSCITLCKGCHKMVHSRKGCRYVDLQCKNKNKYNTVNVILKI